jgi:hypothetical protein
MRKYSFILNVILKYVYLICIFILATLFGCYSFKGGTIPNHLKTLFISNVVDNSASGNPKYRENMTQMLIDKFRNDNSLSLVESGGDAKLTVKISAINEKVRTVSQGSQGELENERELSVVCDVEYYDAVKKKSILKKQFSNNSFYIVTDGAAGRDDAITKALDLAADDILLAVVSGW